MDCGGDVAVVVASLGVLFWMGLVFFELRICGERVDKKQSKIATDLQ